MARDLCRREIKVVGRGVVLNLLPKRLKTGVAKTCTAAYVSATEPLI